MAANAVQSLRRQTWPDKSLIFVAQRSRQASAPEEQWWLRGSAIFDLSVKTMIVDAGYDAPDAWPLGDLRNLSIARVPFDGLFTQWDDDDARHPDFITRMVEHLRGFDRTDGVVLEQITFAWPEKKRFWISCTGRWECSLVAKRSRVPIYPALARGEDSSVAKAMNLVRLTGAPELYYRRVHSANTWDADHFENFYKKKARDCTPAEIVAASRELGL